VSSREEGDNAICFSGWAKRASSFSACWETGVRARFLMGRSERLSREVGTESGPGSDMLDGLRRAC
jgi:hypothetical protein